MVKMNKEKTIVLDFDGVIHQYSKKWHDGTVYDPPMKGAKEAINELLSLGYEIVIHSTRNKEQITEWIEKQDLLNKGRKITVTDGKPIGFVYIDDRALRFTNWKDILNYFR